MASAVDSRLAYARLSAVATASRLPTATRGSNNSYTTSWDTTAFCYPSNHPHSEIDAQIFERFKIIRIAALNLGEEFHYPSGNRYLRAMGADFGSHRGSLLHRTLDDADSEIRKAAESNTILVYYAHRIGNHLSQAQNHISHFALEYVLTRAKQHGFEFVTASELV